MKKILKIQTNIKKKMKNIPTSEIVIVQRDEGNAREWQFVLKQPKLNYKPQAFFCLLWFVFLNQTIHITNIHYHFTLTGARSTNIV